MFNFDRVLAVGRDSYIRVYPNPGVCVCIGKKRIAYSVMGGLEVFKKDARVAWRRVYSKFGRITRPGGK